MIHFSKKLTALLLAASVVAYAGPAFSADAAPAKPKAVAKQKVKTVKAAKPKAKKVAKAKNKAGSKVRPVAKASKPAVAPMVAVTAVAAAPAVVIAAAPEAAAQTGYEPSRPQSAVNPYLAYQQPMSLPDPAANFSQAFGNIKSLLPSIPEGASILPSIKKVYPTGEKPLVVITFKCPTELIGITPIPTKLLHDGVDGLLGALNATNLLSFNLQQVCQ